MLNLIVGEHRIDYDFVNLENTIKTKLCQVTQILFIFIET